MIHILPLVGIIPISEKICFLLFFQIQKNIQMKQLVMVGRIWFILLSSGINLLNEKNINV
ncbi:hypothetical protein C2G38_2070222, partial [Gigaspora rosea]